MIQLTLTLKVTTAQVVETSVTVINNSFIQHYVHPVDHTQPTYEVTPGFKPFTIIRTARKRPLLLSERHHFWPDVLELLVSDHVTCEVIPLFAACVTLRRVYEELFLISYLSQRRNCGQ